MFKISCLLKKQEMSSCKVRFFKFMDRIFMYLLCRKNDVLETIERIQKFEKELEKEDFNSAESKTE